MHQYCRWTVNYKIN